MPIFIYQQSGNPLVRFLVSLAVLAGMVALAVIFLPVIGAIVLTFVLIAIAFVLYGWIYRKINGDPIDNLQKAMRRAQDEARERYRQTSANQSTQESVARVGGQKKWTMKDVEDVEEVKENRE